ncbi:remorin 4.1-like [Phragmites australis]|uniref:remorin 4.1-like n=1 Tax=Phragmites australis TaxID=29695 RepID=UPI002D7A130F|nr:remorin 4.1-like [Phragmites australis]
MGYERIHKVQMGVMSPTKLRMKLLGSHGGSKKEEASGKSSPSRLVVDDDDADHPKNSLLAQELDEEYPKDRSDSSLSRSDASHGRAAHSGGGSGCESGHENGSTGAGGNFEFHRVVMGAAVSGPFFRQVPSKWNDAEKWIAGRHVVHSNPIFSKKPAAPPYSPNGGGRVAPESAASKGGASCDNPSSRGGGAVSAVTELSSKSSSPSSVSKPPQKKLRTATSAAAPAQSVSMRDVGTEMTPIASKEQSRSGTPAGAATPSLSPLCSVPSSPRGGASASSSSSASERELRLRTRREIAALGLQLGKMNIASWASKEEGLLAQASSPPESPGAIDDEIKRKEFEARAAAWELSQKCKLASRYQRKEVKIQEWESCQKSKFEAKMRQAEVQAEQMKARAKYNLAKRLSVLSHRVEGKQARVEARRSRQAVRLARQVERIRKTGREPCRFRRCCTWFL